jgi:hypothetical protein
LAIAERAAMRVSILLLLFVSFTALPRDVRPQAKAAQTGDQDTEEARSVVAEFMRRLQQTRDLAALKDLYLDDFMARILKSNQSPPDFAFNLNLSQELMTQLTPADWERYYFAQTNLRYYMVLHLAAGYSPAQMRAMEKGESAGVNLFPPDVLALLEDARVLARASSSSNDSVETLSQFRHLLVVFEKAGAMMRERFRKEPPEKSKRYRENASVPNTTRAQPKPYLSIEDRERDGFPAGTHFFHMVTEPSLFELSLVRTDRGVKILWARVYPFN